MSYNKNQIFFSVDNQTPFTLVPNPTTFSDWGDFGAGPTTIKPFQKGDAGHVISSRSPFCGSAGIVGYSLTSKNGATIYIRFLASNPYLSVRDNWACVSLSSIDQGINQDTYNYHYYNEPQHASMSFEERTLNLTSNIGHADRATATFVLTYVVPDLYQSSFVNQG
ncbi:hypothetical protein ACKLNR_013733 [Fusarium oxysporum f. sp. zingiberi]